jgi:hypothetical protein
VKRNTKKLLLELLKQAEMNLKVQISAIQEMTETVNSNRSDEVISYMRFEIKESGLNELEKTRLELAVDILNQAIISIEMIAQDAYRGTLTTKYSTASLEHIRELIGGKK